MSGYETPADRARRTYGEPELPEMVRKFESERPMRQAYAARFYESRGWFDRDGKVRPRVTMPDGSGELVTVDLWEQRNNYVATATREWITGAGGRPLTKAECDELERRMKMPDGIQITTLGELLGPAETQRRIGGVAGATDDGW